MNEKKNCHVGHRQRLKNRFLRNGEAAFEDHELLELLLFYAIPQGDMNPLAHRLMEHFGSLSGVFDASVSDLMQVPGVGEHTALLIHMLPQIARRYHNDRSSTGNVLRDTLDYADWLRPYFFGARNEMAYLLCMNANGKILGCDLLDEGDLTSCALLPRQVTSIALRYRASAVVLAHCHVVGSPQPSYADHEATLACRKMLDRLDITLLDHLIFCDGDYVSFAQTGELHRF